MLPPVMRSRPASMRRAVDLAAAGRPDEDEELAVGDLQGEIVYCRYFIEPLGDVVEGDFRQSLVSKRFLTPLATYPLTAPARRPWTK